MLLFFVACISIRPADWLASYSLSHTRCLGAEENCPSLYITYLYYSYVEIQRSYNAFEATPKEP